VVSLKKRKKFDGEKFGGEEKRRVWLFGVGLVDVYTSCRAVLLLCLSGNGLASRIALVKRN
jgi:hypothetical protein